MTSRGSSNNKSFWTVLLLALVMAFSANAVWAQDSADEDEDDSDDDNEDVGGDNHDHDDDDSNTQDFAGES